MRPEIDPGVIVALLNDFRSRTKKPPFDARKLPSTAGPRPLEARWISGHRWAGETREILHRRRGCLLGAGYLVDIFNAHHESIEPARISAMLVIATRAQAPRDLPGPLHQHCHLPRAFNAVVRRLKKAGFYDLATVFRALRDTVYVGDVSLVEDLCGCVSALPRRPTVHPTQGTTLAKTALLQLVIRDMETIALRQKPPPAPSDCLISIASRVLGEAAFETRCAAESKNKSVLADVAKNTDVRSLAAIARTVAFATWDVRTQPLGLEFSLDPFAGEDAGAAALRDMATAFWSNEPCGALVATMPARIAGSVLSAMVGPNVSLDSFLDFVRKKPPAGLRCRNCDRPSRA